MSGGHMISSRPLAFTEIALNQMLTDARNFLTDEQQTLVNREIEHISDELLFRLPDDERLVLKHTTRDRVCSKFPELARAIRNEYDLWIDDHHVTDIWCRAEQDIPLSISTPIQDTEDGRTVLIKGTMLIDDHPCHPDNFSAAVVCRLWDKLQYPNL